MFIRLFKGILAHLQMKSFSVTMHSSPFKSAFKHSFEHLKMIRTVPP